jgi:hypothetical protein
MNRAALLPLAVLALGFGTTFLFTIIGCGDKPVKPVESTSGSTTPGYNYKIPQQIMTPDTVETRVDTCNSSDLPHERTYTKFLGNGVYF